jgi:stage V sporulation protein G
MEITDVRIRKIESQTRLRGIASITIDNAFAIHELRIIEGKDGIFVAMPSRKTSDGVFRDIAHPINIETRKMIEQIVLEKYQEELAKAPEETKEDDAPESQKEELE